MAVHGTRLPTLRPGRVSSPSLVLQIGDREVVLFRKVNEDLVDPLVQHERVAG
jgi:hypothetical protein